MTTDRPTIDEVARRAAPTLWAVNDAILRRQADDDADGHEDAPTPPTAA